MNMYYKLTTQVPNFILDTLLPTLTESELKILLMVTRQTYGWIDQQTGGRKKRDRISGSQFRQKTGLSKRIVTKAIKSLVNKNLLKVSDFKGNPLPFACDRKGKAWMYYSISVPEPVAVCSAQSVSSPVHKSDHNKTNYTKLKRTGTARKFSGHIGELVIKRELFRTPIKG